MKVYVYVYIYSNIYTYMKHYSIIYFFFTQYVTKVTEYTNFKIKTLLRISVLDLEFMNLIFKSSIYPE